MSSFTIKTIAVGLLTSTNITKVYSNPSGKKFRVTSIDFGNKHTIPVDATLWFAPNDGGNERSVSVGDGYDFQPITILAGNNEGQLCDFSCDSANDTIHVKVSVASKINMFIHGIEETL